MLPAPIPLVGPDHFVGPRSLTSHLPVPFLYTMTPVRSLSRYLPPRAVLDTGVLSSVMVSVSSFLSFVYGTGVRKGWKPNRSQRAFGLGKSLAPLLRFRPSGWTSPVGRPRVSSPASRLPPISHTTKLHTQMN